MSHWYLQVKVKKIINTIYLGLVINFLSNLYNRYIVYSEHIINPVAINSQTDVLIV
jgi:hypothetical protein